VLELRDLVKHYQLGRSEEIRAVDGVTMTAGRGEFVALYGPSGSGKTTLLELVAGTLKPDRGTVYVDGREISAMSERDLDGYRLTQLGIIGQPQDLIEGAFAIENASLRLVLSGTRSADKAIVPILDRLGLGDRLKHRTEELSMGERQRVMIALALSTNPSLVLADEPTGNLDSDRTLEVLSLLREICAEREATVLLATHDPLAVGFADQVHELRDGHLRDYQPKQPVPPGGLIGQRE
jgi:putative ABC transport system ATP-binding protein